MAASSTMTQTITPSLSNNDSAVLQALFDAESSPSSSAAAPGSGGGVHIDPSITQKLPNIPNAELERLQARERDAISRLRRNDGQEEDKLSKETISKTVHELSTIVAENPGYAGAYINRAQALRMLLEHPSSSPSEPGKQDAATQLFADLSRSISLLTPTTSSTSTSISPSHASLLATSHTHRAYILYTSAHSPPSPSTLLLPPHLRHLPPSQLEDMASADFALAGQYGSEVSRRLAVKTNPYAKMCGAIVREAVREERGFMTST